MFSYLRLLAGTSNLKWNAPLQYTGHVGEGVFKGFIYGVDMSSFDLNFRKSSSIGSTDQDDIKFNFVLFCDINQDDQLVQ